MRTVGVLLVLALVSCAPAEQSGPGQPASSEAATAAQDPLAALALPALASAADLAADRARVEACLQQTGEKSLSSDLCVGVIQGPCIDASPDNQSTAGMVGCTDREVLVWQALLADANAATATLSPEMKAAVARAQASFVANRDIQCGLAAIAYEGGTMAAPASAGCVKNLTAEQFLRIREFAPQ